MTLKQWLKAIQAHHMVNQHDPRIKLYYERLERHYQNEAWRNQHTANCIPMESEVSLWDTLKKFTTRNLKSLII